MELLQYRLKTVISQDELKRVLSYDENSGLFTRIAKVKRSKAKIGDIAGTKHSLGYIIITIGKKKYKAHRLAFVYMNGEVGDFIDHINHVRDDNRWSNLREVTRAENSRNRLIHSSNKSGVSGVSWHSTNKRWCSKISIDNKSVHLGSFVEFHEAVNARKNAEVLYGYHENHGVNFTVEIEDES